jgi:hypothetical protein
MSDKEEKIFDKPEKPKRKLTEKQLAALAAGREKARKKKLEKLAQEGQKEQKKEKKEQKKEKKVRIKEQDVLRDIQSKEKKAKAERVRKQRVADWDEKRHKMLKGCQNTRQFELLSEALDTITEEDLEDQGRLNGKLLGLQKKFQELDRKEKEKK